MNQPTLFPARWPSALFSECDPEMPPHVCSEECKGRRYRYLLKWPTGIENERVCLWAMANPSKASALSVDPTVNRCIRYARAWGYGWCWVVNARAWRATDPKDVPPDPKAIGGLNDAHVLDAAAHADLVVCGWGALGGARGPVMLGIIRRAGKVPHALKLNADMSPSHPLYLRNDAKPFPLDGVTSGENER